MENITLFLGLLLVGVVLSALIVLFVSPKAFPRKEFMGVVWPLVKKYWWKFVGILFIQQGLVNLPGVIVDIVRAVYKLADEEPFTALFDLIATTILGVILQAGLVGIALQVIAGNVPRLGDLFSQWKLFWRYLGASILYGLMTVGGLLLLIVPGMIWFLKFSLWPYFMVEKNVGIIESLKMSSRATAGYKGSLFVLYIYLGALTLLGIAALFLGLFVTTPIAILTLAYVYHKMSGTLQSPVSPPQPA